MEYSIFYHTTCSSYSAGVEIQPPLDEDAVSALRARFLRRLAAPVMPQRLRGVGDLYSNGGSSEGTHFLAWRAHDAELHGIRPARGVASYLAILLRQDGHKVTVAHRPEWDGELMGSRDVRQSPAEEVASSQPEPQSGSEVAAVPTPEILPAMPETPES